MEELLTTLYDNMCGAFDRHLKSKELCFFSNSSIDVFKTLLSLKKNNNDLNKIMIDGSVSIDELEYRFTKEKLNACFDYGYLIKGNSIHSDKAFIGTNGLYKLYSVKGYNLNNIFLAYDAKFFNTEQTLSLKSQEKVWCIFLLLFGADSEEKLFDSNGLSPKKLQDYHNFFITIEAEMDIRNIILGKKINWKTGKDSVFRKFITNNVDLPKTGLYNKDRPYEYFLDLGKRRSAKYLLDLILDNYNGESRLIANDFFYEGLIELSFKLNTELGEMPGEINKFIIQELKG